jgi:hypothetical protein
MSNIALRSYVCTKFVVLAASFALLLTSHIASAYVIDFSNLAGPTDNPYTGSSQGGFTVTPTTTDWYQGLVYGNPLPSIYDGPVFSPGAIATISITDGGGLFNFNSVDYSSNNGGSSYDIKGLLGASVVFDQSGLLSGTFSPFAFSTLLSSYAAASINDLVITVQPGTGTTSINLDNINVSAVTSVPDSGMATVFMFGGALVLLVCLRRFYLVA